MPTFGAAPIVLSAALAFGALPIPGMSATAGVAARTHTIIIDKMKFGPAPTNVRVGDTILWLNNDMFRHTATARDRTFNIDLPPSASGKSVVKRSGTIPFYCVFHPGMTGKLVVTKR